MKFFFLLMLFASNICFSQVSLNWGLQAYFSFDGNAKDQSGNNNHTVFNNATLANDRFGNEKSAYYFNGLNTYMKVPNSKSLNMGNKLSISLWVKPTGFYTGKCYNNMMLMKGDADYLKGNYSLRFSDVYTGCDQPTTKNERFFDGNGAIAMTPIVQLNNWYHVVVAYDGANAWLYINCELKATYPFSASFTNGYDLYIGCLNNAQFPYWLKGYLDEIRIYNRTLNIGEVRALCDMKPTRQVPIIKKTEFVGKKPKLPETKSIVVAYPEIKETVIEPKTFPELVIIGELPTNKIEKENSLFNEIKLEERTNNMVREITVEQDSIAVTLYDNGIVDGDSVTLIFNDKILTTHQLLSEKPITFYIKIAPGNSRNELVMYAENLGSIPPNTALMVIYDGEKRYEVNVSSSKTSNGVVSFKLKE